MPVAADSTSPVGGNVQEGQMKEYMWKMAERLSLEQFLEHFPEDEEFWRAINDDINDKPQSEGIDDDDGGFVDLPGSHVATGSFNRGGYNKLTSQSYQDKLDYLHRQLSDPQQSVNYPELRARLMDLQKAAKLSGLIKEGSKFSFANPKQKPGDQVRGTEVAKKKKSGAHPFAGRLVGAMESEQVADEAKATKTRLDPKCWKGKKIGNPKTKVKGGVRVNNCVPMEEEYEQYMNELVGTYGMTTGGTATGDAQKADPETAKKIATVQQGVNKLKSAGVNIPSGQQAVQSLMKDPVKDPQSQLDKTIDAGLGQEVQDIVTKGDAGDVNQLASLIRKINQKSGA
jgi:hypothetical protein